MRNPYWSNTGNMVLCWSNTGNMVLCWSNTSKTVLCWSNTGNMVQCWPNTGTVYIQTLLYHATRLLTSCCHLELAGETIRLPRRLGSVLDLTWWPLPLPLPLGLLPDGGFRCRADDKLCGGSPRPYATRTTAMKPLGVWVFKLENKRREMSSI